MKDKDLLFNAKKLQNQASKVIKELLLKERWGKIGKVNFSGSLTFGLMINPNIDMQIYTDNPNPKSGFKIISEIAQTVGVKRIKYVNQMEDEIDPGLYYCIQYIDKNNLMWSIDSWLISRNHPFAHHLEKFTNAMNKRLNDEIRLKILRIKNDIYEHAETKIRSIDIYKAILRDGIENYGEFFEWFKKNPPRKLENWLP